MSYRIDTSDLISGAYVIGETGLGVLGSAVPSGGGDGPPPLYNDLSLPTDANKEYCFRITTMPVGYTSFFMYEDSSFTLAGPDGTYTIIGTIYEDGVSKGSEPVNVVVGSQGLVPDPAFLSFSGYAPTVAQSGLVNRLVTPAAGALVFTGYASTVSQSGRQTVQPAVRALTITGNAPGIVQTGLGRVNLLPSLLAFTGYAPIVVQMAIAKPSPLPNADIQRLVNLYPVKLEPAGDVPFIHESVPGLGYFSALVGESRGCIATNDRAFVVQGSGFYEIDADGRTTLRGSLSSETGPVSMAYGTSQVVMVDGSSGYVFTLTTNAFGRVASDSFYGSNVVRFIDNYFLFQRPDTQQFYISAINDATTLDALDFASAESQPDGLVTIEVDHSEIYLFGQYTTEVWFNGGNADFPFQRSQGSGMEVGCMAANSVKQIDNSILWLGRDKNGSGMVYRAQGHQPVRVSTHAVERALRRSTDLSAATAWAYQRDGLTFYGINAPGMDSTWVYEVSTNQWHERCDLDELGEFKASRVQTMLFAFDKHLAGGDDGVIYELDHDTYMNGNDPLVRETISPLQSAPGSPWQRFKSFWLDVSTGQAAQGDDPQVELSWTDNVGKDWSNAVPRSLGKVGEVFPPLHWTRLGRSKKRAWKIRFSGNAAYSIRSYSAEKADH